MCTCMFMYVYVCMHAGMHACMYVCINRNICRVHCFTRGLSQFKPLHTKSNLCLLALRPDNDDTEQTEMHAKWPQAL